LKLFLKELCLTYSIFVIRKATVFFATYSTHDITVHVVKQQPTTVVAHSRA